MVSTDLRADIIAANQQFMAAFGRRDAAGLATLYTTTGQLLPPNSEVVAGREAIRTFWQGAMDLGLTQAQLDTVEVEGHGETAVEVGEVHPAGGGRAGRGYRQIRGDLENRGRDLETAPGHLEYEPSRGRQVRLRAAWVGRGRHGGLGGHESPNPAGGVVAFRRRRRG